ncbi:MAG: MarR family winged helix-turn-helix transcriptional regulator [Microbacterium sp.]|uniref:MarR family winged helix-turn-helix transcriptional regulator n=1 Tax=Microbacterium sp. TaxID=51671 RepID=UPI003A88FB30
MMMPGSQHLTDLVTRIRRVLRASVRSEIPWEALPMAQVEVLQRLDDEPGIRISEMARRHRLATNTVSTIIQQMVVAGLVAREPDPLDRRAVSLHLTKQGRQTLDQWLHANQERVSAAMQQLSADELSMIEKSLPALTSLVQSLEADHVQRMDVPTAPPTAKA